MCRACPGSRGLILKQLHRALSPYALTRMYRMSTQPHLTSPYHHVATHKSPPPLATPTSSPHVQLAPGLALKRVVEGLTHEQQHLPWWGMGGGVLATG